MTRQTRDTSDTSSANDASVEPILARLDELLCRGVFFVGHAPVYEFRVRASGGDVVFTWDPERGIERRAASRPTCIVDMDLAAARELAFGTASPPSLLASGRVRVGGLVDAIEGLGSVFAPPAERGAIAAQRVDTVMPPCRRRALAAMVDEKLARIGSKTSLDRVRRMLHLWTEHSIDRCQLDQWVRSPFPDLPVTAWVDPRELEVDAIVRRSHDGLLAEAKRFLHEVKAPHYAGRYDAPDETAANRPQGWRQWHIVSNFEFDAEHAARFPVAEAVAREIARDHTILYAYYLILEPGVVLPLHADGVDWALSYHHGLLVPDGAYLTAAHETRKHSVGGSLVFNDSFVHSAGNTGTEPRVVLNIVLANPRLTAIERAGVRCLVESLPSGSLAYAR